MPGIDEQLKSLGVPASLRQGAGACWQQPADLLGYSHRVEINWTPCSWSARRLIGGPEGEQEIWSVKACASSSRFTVEEARGQWEGEPTLAEARQRVRTEALLLGWPSALSSPPPPRLR